METDVVTARKNFSELLNRATYGRERVTITRRRKPVAAVVPIEDLKTLEALEDRIDLEEARRVLADKSDKAVPWDKAKKILGL